VLATHSNGIEIEALQLQVLLAMSPR
jgi:hypothetical protein